MITKDQIEKILRELKPFIAKKFHVSKIGYFGSYARGEADPKSDIDILVEFSAPVGLSFFRLMYLLEEKLNTKIDLVSIKALKPQLKDIILNEVKFIND